jgi:type II secretion system protein C
LGLCCAIAGLIWSSVYPLARGVAFADPLERLQQTPPQPIAMPGFAEYEVIGGRNLFKREGPAAPPVQEVRIEPSRLQVKLLGTVAAGPEQTSVGVVKDASANKVQIIKLGDTIGGQAKVVSIEQRRIVLQRDGKLEEIVVEPPDPRLRSAKRTSTAGQQRPVDGGNGTDKVQARLERRMMEQLRRMNNGTAPVAAPQAAVSIASDAESPNAANGVQLQQISPNSKLAAIGLQPGDRIMSVDGVRITNSVPLGQLLASLGSNRTKVFEVERGGSPTQIEVPSENVLELINELGGAP